MLKYPNGWRELQVLRAKDHLSLRDLSRLANVPIGLLSDLEQGKRKPTERVIGKLSWALKVPTSVLQPHPYDSEDDVYYRVNTVQEFGDAA